MLSFAIITMAMAALTATYATGRLTLSAYRRALGRARPRRAVALLRLGAIVQIVAILTPPLWAPDRWIGAAAQAVVMAAYMLGVWNAWRARADPRPLLLEWAREQNEAGRRQGGETAIAEPSDIPQVSEVAVDWEWDPQARRWLGRFMSDGRPCAAVYRDGWRVWLPRHAAGVGSGLRGKRAAEAAIAELSQGVDR